MGWGEPSVGCQELFLKHRRALRQGLEGFAGVCQGYGGDPQSQNRVLRHFHFNSKLKGKFPF